MKRGTWLEILQELQVSLDLLVVVLLLLMSGQCREERSLPLLTLALYLFL